MRFEGRNRFSVGLITILAGFILTLQTVSPMTVSLAFGQEKRPSIVWIVAEDMSADLESYGREQVLTPNLSGLARRGVQFENAFATSPLCSSSRSAFITGMYQTSIGAHHQRLPQFLAPELPRNVKTVPQILKNNGYFTVNAKRITTGVSGTGKDDWNFRSTKDNRFQSSDVSKLTVKRPFFMQINFSESHRSFNSPKSADPTRIKLPSYYPDHPVSRQDFAGYLDDITALDRKVGKVIQWLKSQKLDENTVIIFFSDHGRPMIRGKQWCYDSGLKVPLIIWHSRPNGKRYFVAGKRDRRLVSLIDVAATTVDLAGVKVPDWMQGRSLLCDDKPDRSFVFGASDRDGECTLRIRSIRSSKFHFLSNGFPERPAIYSTAYRKANHPMFHLINKMHQEGRLSKTQTALVLPRPKEEFYDVEKDPEEIRNLVDDPKYKKEVEDFRVALKQWQEETGDQGLQKDSAAVERHFLEYGKKSEKSRRKKIEKLKRKVYSIDERIKKQKKPK